MMKYQVLVIAGFSALSVFLHQPGARSLNNRQPRVSATASRSETLVISRASGSLPNNTNITAPQGTQGSGVLKVINGSPRDAAIKLVDRASGTTLRFVYVRGNQSVQITGIGTYRCILKYTTGSNWNSNTRRFSKNVSFYQFPEILNFSRGRQRVTYQATLHSVNNGNTVPRTIDEREF
jgi:hypothetical protein